MASKRVDLSEKPSLDLSGFTMICHARSIHPVGWVVARVAALVAGLGLAGCGAGKDASTAAATSDVESTSADPFAKSVVDIATLKGPPAYYGSALGIRDPRRISFRLADELAPYYGDCTSAGCARMLDLKTNKVLDASTLGVFVDTKGSTNDPAWQLSPKRQWVVFRKTSADPDKAAGNANLLAFADLGHGEKATALPPSGYDAWVTDDLLLHFVSTTKARGIDPKTQAVKFEVEVPEPDQKFGLTYPAVSTSADTSTVVIAGNKAAKLIKVADSSVSDVKGWDALANPRVQVLPARSGFVITSESTHDSRVVVSTLAADGTLKILADAAEPMVAIASDGRFAYARPATADRPQNGPDEAATVVIHDEGKPDVELTTQLSGTLAFSPDAKWIKAEAAATSSTFARTDASGAMKPFAPAFDDKRVASGIWITPTYTQAIVRATMPSNQADARLYTVDLATGAKTEILHDASAVEYAGVVIEPSAKDPTAFVLDRQNGGVLLTLAGNKLGEVTDLDASLGWSHGWLFYLAKPAVETSPWQRQLRAVSRDGKTNVAIGAKLDEILSVISGDWMTQPRGDTVQNFVIRSGLKVFALIPPTYEPKAAPPVQGPTPPTTTSGDDDKDAVVVPPVTNPKKPGASSSPNEPSSNGPSAEESPASATTPAAPKTENVTSTACSAAPGSHRSHSSAFGAALLFALVALGRRRFRK